MGSSVDISRSLGGSDTLRVLFQGGPERPRDSLDQTPSNGPREKSNPKESADLPSVSLSYMQATVARITARLKILDLHQSERRDHQS